MDEHLPFFIFCRFFFSFWPTADAVNLARRNYRRDWIVGLRCTLLFEFLLLLLLLRKWGCSIERLNCAVDLTALSIHIEHFGHLMFAA